MCSGKILSCNATFWHYVIKSLHTVLPSTWILFYDVLKNKYGEQFKKKNIVVKVLRAKVNSLHVVAFQFNTVVESLLLRGYS